MLIPVQFAFTTTGLDLMNAISPKTLYGIRAALGIGVGFIAFQGVRK